ncbi:hypothetical protein GBF38_022347 [Nibea albiflora]|uniref:Uncharacterized protein n=1 Tax=Nibea albiflora TaxID=240163 RepID=A0ACB7FKV3_NIBAL|nr:hypothetical protein GBF38_022347 [Nibea albiflora]
MDTLGKQASELRAAELSIYDSRVKLEQVSMENSRLHLRIRQMTEGVSRARENKERCWRETIQFHQEVKALFESLQEAWREDFSITQDSQSRDRDLLALMGALISRLETRGQQLRNVSTLVHHQMLQFSKRLGESIEQSS